MQPDRKIRTPSSLPRPAKYALYVAVTLFIPAFALLSGGFLRGLLEFGAGVLSLVSLTSAVIWGLVATDRILLDPRERLLAQGIHRGLAVASLGFLLMHIALKIAADHAGFLAALVPFGPGIRGTAGLIGLGSLAAYLMVFAGATGAMRSVLAPSGPVAARWRAMHSLAYPAWGAALVHGLYAGRPAAGWVAAMYSACLVGVAAALGVRLLPQPQRRRIARMLLSVTRPGGRVTAPEPFSQQVRDPLVAPLPGAGRVPAGFAETTRVQEPALRLDSTRPTRPAPIGAGLGSGISAAYRAVSSAARPSEPEFGSPAAGPVPPGQLSEPVTEPLPSVSSYAAPTEPLPSVPSYGPSSDLSSVRWPAPSPSPPAESVRSGAAPDTLGFLRGEQAGVSDGVGTTPGAESGATDGWGATPYPQAGATDGLGFTPYAESGATDTPGVMPYPESGATDSSGFTPPQTGATDGSGFTPYPQSGASDTLGGQSGPQSDTRSGPPYPPSPGEPWHQSARGLS